MGQKRRRGRDMGDARIARERTPGRLRVTEQGQRAGRTAAALPPATAGRHRGCASEAARTEATPGPHARQRQADPPPGATLRPQTALPTRKQATCPAQITSSPVTGSLLPTATGLHPVQSCLLCPWSQPTPRQRAAECLSCHQRPHTTRQTKPYLTAMDACRVRCHLLRTWTLSSPRPRWQSAGT